MMIMILSGGVDGFLYGPTYYPPLLGACHGPYFRCMFQRILIVIALIMEFCFT